MIYAATSTTVIELGGLVPGSDHDQLNHIGRVQLGGSLSVQLINAFTPSLADTFTVMTATDGFNGNFNAIDLPVLSQPLTWQIDMASDRLNLTVVLANQAPTDLALSASSIPETSPLEQPLAA